MLIAIALLGAGLAVLFAGGHYLLRGAIGLALLARLSTTVVALTVVAMGTSLPELAVSVGAAARGSTDIAYANVVGSNIFNVGAILAVAALVAPIPVKRQTIRIEYPFMFVASCVVVLLARDGSIDRLEGSFFVISLLLFISYTVHLARREVERDEAATWEREVRRAAHVQNGERRAWRTNIGLILIGLVALTVGAELTIRGAVTVARSLDIEERIIGLTVIAMGTSLPELATSFVAARRGELEIALGNIVGSNVFNLLAVLGITSATFVVPVHPTASAVDNWVMLGLSALMFPLMLFGKRVSRADGVLLLVGFLAYMAYVVVTR